MIRSAPAALLAVAAAALLLGCGRGDELSTQTSAKPAPGGSAPGAPGAPTNAPPTSAQAHAFARAVNLRASDVPGLKPTAKQPKQESAAGKQLEAKLRRCVGDRPGSGSGSSGSGSTNGRDGEVADVSSPEFKRQLGPFSQSVSSAVSVGTSAAAASQELRAMHAHDVRACLTEYVTADLAKARQGSVTIAPVKVAEGTPPAPGTSGSFGWRITSGLVVHGITVPFYMDILGFVYGPAQVSLTSFGIPRALPAGSEEQLFTLLVQRATAHPL